MIINDRIETKEESLKRLFNTDFLCQSSLVRDVLRIEDANQSENAIAISKMIKKAEERSPRLSLFTKFLSADILNQIINRKVFPKYKKGLISVAADNVIRDGYEIEQKVWFDWNDYLKPVNSEEIQTGPENDQNALVQGYYFLTKKDTKENVIFGIDFIDGFMTGYIAVYSSDSNKKVASQLIKDILTWIKDNNFLKGQKIDACGRFIKTDDTTLDDVIIKDEVKRRIKSGTVHMMDNMEVYRKNGLPIKRGVLMEGAPGTGKTLVAKALCNQMDCTFIWVTADDVKYPEDISGIYGMARELAPTIVLFEDIDYIGKKREGYSGSFDKITGELLNQMDGVESNEGLITLASSNYPKALDKALRNRPGRFDVRVRFDLPDADLREKMINKFFSSTDITDLDIEDLIQKTDRYTGAYIKELSVASIMLAVMDDSTDSEGAAVVKKKHFNEAFKELEESRNLDDTEDE